MIDSFNEAIETYFKKWQALIGQRTNKQFFEALKPTSIGWKVADRAEYNRICSEMHDQTDMIVEKWMNGRWIAKLHLRDTKLSHGIEIIKVMERRPGSTDAVGLDHLDFYGKGVDGAEEILKKEPDLKWTWEKNDTVVGYEWLSLWFDETEAKLKSGTVLDVIQEELQEINKQITT